MGDSGDRVGERSETSTPGAVPLSPDRTEPIVVHDGERIVYVNEAFLDLCEAESRSELVDASLFDLLAPASREPFADRIERVADGDIPAQGLLVTLDPETWRRDRELITVSTPVQWDGASRVQTTFVEPAPEIAGRSLHTHAANRAPIGITIADVTQEDEPLVYVNDEFVELTGYSREECVGRNCRFLQGERTQEEPIAEMRAAIEAREPVTVVLRNYRKDGTMFWNRVTLTPIASDTGEITHYLGYQEDVSETKLYERERTLFEKHADASDHAMFVTDSEGRIEYVNPAFERMTGYTAAEAIGENPRLLKSDAQDDQFYADLWETITAGEVWEAELTNRTKSGEQYRIRQTIVPITDDHDEITHFVAIEQDITDEQFIEQVLDVMNRVLRHNVRTSVNVIEGYAEMLAGDLEESEHHAAARVIQERADALRKVSEQTSEIRELFRRRDDPKTIPASAIADFVERAVDRFPNARVDCSIEVDEDQSLRNGELLELALREAIENAVVHSDRDEPQVTVTVSRADGDGGDLLISVADDGPGIPKSEWDIITVGEETPLLHTSGIGLWLMYWTTTAIGGSIELEENEPRGSIVTFRVPDASE